MVWLTFKFPNVRHKARLTDSVGVSRPWSNGRSSKNGICLLEVNCCYRHDGASGLPKVMVRKNLRRHRKGVMLAHCNDGWAVWPCDADTR